jgi:hypothetical protein
MADRRIIAGSMPKARGACFGEASPRSSSVRDAIFVCCLGALLSGCLNAQERSDQSIQKMEALDDSACRQQTASVEELMRAQAYAECRRLRVAYWQVGASPNTAQAQPQAENANAPAAKVPLTPTQARQGAAWRTCAVTPNAPQC